MLMLIDYHLRFATRDPATGSPNCTMSLINANYTDLNMFAQDEIEQAVKNCMGKLTATHLCSEVKKPESYKGVKGQITIEILKERLPPPSTAPTGVESFAMPRNRSRQFSGEGADLRHRGSQLPRGSTSTNKALPFILANRYVDSVIDETMKKTDSSSIASERGLQYNNSSITSQTGLKFNDNTGIESTSAAAELSGKESMAIFVCGYVQYVCGRWDVY